MAVRFHVRISCSRAREGVYEGLQCHDGGKEYGRNYRREEDNTGGVIDQGECVQEGGKEYRGEYMRKGRREGGRDLQPCVGGDLLSAVIVDRPLSVHTLLDQHDGN